MRVTHALNYYGYIDYVIKREPYSCTISRWMHLKLLPLIALFFEAWVSNDIYRSHAFQPLTHIFWLYQEFIIFIRGQYDLNDDITYLGTFPYRAYLERKMSKYRKDYLQGMQSIYCPTTPSGLRGALKGGLTRRCCPTMGHLMPKCLLR